jgi:hypothetical protein
VIGGTDSKRFGLNYVGIDLGMYIEGIMKNKYIDSILLLSVALAFGMLLLISVPG